LPWLKSVRGSYGPELTVVDFSASGLKVDVENFHLRPGSHVIVEIVANAGQLSVPANVLRCTVVALKNPIKYRGALVFNSAIDLAGLAREIVGRQAAARGMPTPGIDFATDVLANSTEFVLSAPAEPTLPVGWNRIVVRYADGRLAKGFCRDFFPPRGHFHLWQQPSEVSRDRVTIPIGDLKAVFFVRDFDGNPCYVDGGPILRPLNGRLIAVTFLDDEELTGTTMNYQPGALGFFIQPVDSEDNNLRAYVVSRAVRHVRFL
jgi:hypothetical protein